jgi:mRNA interferase RelE/StbE
MPTLQIKGPAEKDIRDLDPTVRERIITAIQSLRETPFPHQSQKLKGPAHHYRLRVGDYRILYEFDDKLQVVTIYRVKHRREAYR